MYKVARHYSKSKQYVPISYIKVSGIGNCCANAIIFTTTRPKYDCFTVVHVSTIPKSGVHSLIGNLSPRHKASELVIGPSVRCSETL